MRHRDVPRCVALEHHYNPHKRSAALCLPFGSKSVGAVALFFVSSKTRSPKKLRTIKKRSLRVKKINCYVTRLRVAQQLEGPCSSLDLQAPLPIIGFIRRLYGVSCFSLGLRTLLPIIGLIQHLYGVSEASTCSHRWRRFSFRSWYIKFLHH